jgi:hypothetical protein
MTPFTRVALSLLVIALLGTTGNRDVTSPDSFEPTIGPRVAQISVPLPETLRVEAGPDPPLILSLPAEVNGRSVDRYRLLQGPALSGVAGRSFTWLPQDADPGPHEALLRTHAPDAPADTLVLRIDLQS